MSSVFNLLWTVDPENETHLMVAPYYASIFEGDSVIGVEDDTIYKVLKVCSPLEGSSEWNMFVLMASEEPEKVSKKIVITEMNWKEGEPF